MSKFYYSTIGILALVTLIILHYKYFLQKDERREIKDYRNYVGSVILYTITDIAWGILHGSSHTVLLYADTILYYITMGLSVVLCCRYIISFLKLNNKLGKTLIVFGMLFCIAEIIVLAINHFYHVFFWFENDDSYVAYFYRDLALIVQIFMFGCISLMSLVVALRTHNDYRGRNMAICLFGCCMLIALTAQYLYPELPLYSCGLMIGTLIIHVFIHNDEIQLHLKQIETLNEDLKTEQAELQKQKDEIATAFGIINGLSHDFHTIWWADKDDMKLHLVRAPGAGVIPESVKLAFDYADCDLAMRKYIEKYVSEEDKERMYEQVNVKTVLEHLSKSDFYAVNYKRVKANGETDYNQAAFANADTVDGKPRMVFGFRDVNDIISQVMALRKEIDDNIAANKAKTTFLQNMSHEIRTPLNAMFGFAQLLGLPDGSWTDEEKEQYNKYIYNSYNMLDMLISDIIDIADSEHNNFNITLSNVKLNNVCQNSIMSVEYRVPANVKLYYTSDFNDDDYVISDERRIQQVLINYLTNACKNTQQGEIHLHCSKTENAGKITFSVTDTGKGVPKEKAEVIFNRFTKLNRFVQGSGLGLNICLTIANKLGGDVHLDTTYTNGARFVFTIDDKKE